MALTVYRKQLKTGGGATALDGIDGAILLDLDECTVYQSGVAYTYILNTTSGAADDGLNTIAPDTNPGTKRWILNKSYTLMTDDEAVAMSSKAPKVSPVFTTPSLGFATAASVNGNNFATGSVTIPASSTKTITVTIDNGRHIRIALILFGGATSTQTGNMGMLCFDGGTFGQYLDAHAPALLYQWVGGVITASTLTSTLGGFTFTVTNASATTDVILYWSATGIVPEITVVAG